jgi:hypothetical protein
LSQGNVYHLNLETFKPTLLSASHTAPVCRVIYPTGLSDRFVAAAADGDLAMWEAADYTAVFRTHLQRRPVPSLGALARQLL